MRRLLLIAMIFLGLAVRPAFASCPLVPGAQCDGQPCGGETVPTGQVIFNADYNVLQVCRNGGSWLALGPIGPGPASCSLDGETVIHGASFLFFNAQTSANCLGASQLRTCTFGNLDGDPSYQYASCGPTGCDSIGDACSDGSIYAGLSPDGNMRMYTTPADAGQFAWNDVNSTGYTTTNQTSNVTGQANTAALSELDSNSDVGGMQPHRAAQHCADLVAHGQSDWYLSARDELNVLRVNRAAIGGFNLSGSYPAGWYWSSSENSLNLARGQRFVSGGQDTHLKNDDLSVRCVRKGP